LVPALPLLVGAWIALKWKVPGRVVGFVSAFGAGALISAIAFELVLDASEHADSAIPGVALAAGAVTCFMGSRFLQSRAKPGGESARGLALLIGAALDGIPDSREKAGLCVGPAATLGFAVAFALHQLGG